MAVMSMTFDEEDIKEMCRAKFYQKTGTDSSKMTITSETVTVTEKCDHYDRPYGHVISVTVSGSEER